MEKTIKHLLCVAMLLSGAIQKLEANQSTNGQLKKSAPIKVICSAALVPPERDQHKGVSRRDLYIQSLNVLKRYGCEPYVVESIASGPTFLDDYCDHVCYTHSNNLFVTNQGINEAISLKIGLRYFDFDPDDMIIKLTGRYTLETDEFIRLVQYNSDADVIVRAWTDNDAYSALFAIRARYFLDFIENYINYPEWLKHNNDYVFEHMLGAYITKIKKEGARIIYLPRMYDYMPIDPQFLPRR